MFTSMTLRAKLIVLMAVASVALAMVGMAAWRGGMSRRCLKSTGMFFSSLPFNWVYVCSRT